MASTTFIDQSTVIPASWLNDVNTLTYSGISYSTGTWTPVLTFQTAGNLAITYASQIGSYLKIGNLVFLSFNIQTSSFTHTTASGFLRVTGLPFSSNATITATGELQWTGINKATYTDITTQISPGTNQIVFVASGNGVVASTVNATDTPTGGLVTLVGSIIYQDV